jgi:hypothetical protein
MSHVNEAQSSPNTTIARDELWYIHYLLGLAIEKALRP